MASSTFETHKAKLDDACAFLRSFTLGRRGFTLRDAAVGIERVEAECEGLERFLTSRPTAKEAATLVAAARANVVAAKARVALLTKEQT